MFGFNREMFRRHGQVADFVGVIRKFELERIELKTVTGAAASVDYTADEAFGRKYAINGANRVRMTFDVKTANLAGGETVTATLYHRKKDSDDFFIVGTLTAVVPVVTISSNKVRGSVEFSDTLGLLKKATHIGITGATITVANTCVVDFGLEMWNEDEISVSGDGIATEVTATAILAKQPALTGSGSVPTVCEPDMGAAVYSTTKGHFTAAINNGAKTATIVWDVDKCVPAPFTLAARHIRRAQLVSATGVRTELSVAQCTVSSLTITFTDAPANFATGQLIDIWLQGAEMTNWVDVLQEITVPDVTGAAGSINLYPLIGDGRQYEEILITAHRKTSGSLKASAAADNTLIVASSDVPLGGDAAGQIAKLSGDTSDFTAFGMKWSKNLAITTWQVLSSKGAVATTASLFAPYFKNLSLAYVFKADAAPFTAVIHVHAKRISK